MSTPHHASPDDIDIAHVFTALRRSTLRLLFVSALVGALVYGLASMVAPTYQSEAALEVVARDTSNPFVDPATDGRAPDSLSVRMDKQAVNTHVRAIQSSEIATTIATAMSLARKPEFNSALGPVDAMDAVLRIAGIGAPRPGATEEDRVLDAFYQKLTVSSPPESRIINISFLSHDPELAAAIANGLAETYQQRLASVTVVETGELQKALAPKIAALTREVAAAESAVSRFRAKAGLLEGGAQKTLLNDQQLGDLTTELTKASAARTAAEARAANARQLMRRGTPEVIPEVQKSPLMQNLIQQKVQVQRDLLKASAAMKSAHPVIRQLDADLLAIRRQIASEVANVVSSLEKEALVAAEQENALRKSLEKVKTNVAGQSDASAKLRQLQAIAGAKRSELQRLQAQYESNRARVDQDVVPVEARLITRARPSGVPVAPKKGAWAGLSALAAFLIGLVIVLTKALFTGARSAATAKAGATALHPASNMDLAHEERFPDLEPQRMARPHGGAQSGATTAGDGAGRSIAEPSLPEPTPPAPMPNAPTPKPAITAPVAVAAPMSSPGASDPHANATASHQGSKGQTAAAPPRLAPNVMTATADLAARLDTCAGQQAVGTRTLVAIEDDVSRRAGLVLDVARQLSGRGRTVLVIDWSLSGRGICRHLGLPAHPGFNELMQGGCRFSEVVRSVPGTKVHAIASGQALSAGESGLDPDQLNLILDALDEAYDHIVVVAEKRDAALLFEAIQGRFDAGITIPATTDPATVVQPHNAFLGFEVTDLELVTFVETTSGPSAADSPIAAPAASAGPTADRMRAALGQNRQTGSNQAKNRKHPVPA